MGMSGDLEPAVRAGSTIVREPLYLENVLQGFSCIAFPIDAAILQTNAEYQHFALMSKITSPKRAYLKLLDDEDLRFKRFAQAFANMVNLLPNFYRNLDRHGSTLGRHAASSARAWGNQHSSEFRTSLIYITSWRLDS